MRCSRTACTSRPRRRARRGAAVGLTMAEFSDTVRPGIEHLSKLGRPDVAPAPAQAPRDRQLDDRPRDASRRSSRRTIPLRVDRERIALHARRQRERGGRHLDDLRQPHWQRTARIEREPIAARPDGQPRTATRGARAARRGYARPTTAATRSASSASDAAPHAPERLRELSRAGRARPRAERALGAGRRTRRSRSSPIRSTWRCSS